MRFLPMIVIAITSSIACGQGTFTVISNANVVDVSSGKVLKETSILIKDGVIEQVMSVKKMKLPPNTWVIDGTSNYVIPGLTDAHIHFSQSGGLYTRPDAFDFTKIVPYKV